MSNIDYMKVIGVLSKTLNMETLDIRYPDKSPDTIDVTMGGPSMRERKFRIGVRGYTIDVSIPGDYFPDGEIEKLRLKFEYELEQAFLTNVSTSLRATAAGHVLTASF